MQINTTIYTRTRRGIKHIIMCYYYDTHLPDLVPPPHRPPRIDLYIRVKVIFFTKDRLLSLKTKFKVTTGCFGHYVWERNRNTREVKEWGFIFLFIIVPK